MHLAACFSLALLAVLPPTLSSPSQSSWSSPSVDFTPTLVDALSADPDYSSLLVLLQRSRLIPTLNKLNNATFFAPTNSAIKKHSLTHPLWLEALENEGDAVPDNVNEELRQQLLYHLLNETLSALPTDGALYMYKTLLFPKPIGPPTQDPPPSPPWLPIPGGTLGGEPQRLRLAAHKDTARIGADAFGNKGAKIVKGVQDAGNGILLGIADVLEPPPDLGKYLHFIFYFYFGKLTMLIIIERSNRHHSASFHILLPENRQ